MSGADEKRADRRRHDDRRAGSHPEGAQTRNHDRCVHCIDTAAASGIDCLVVSLHEFAPVLRVCINNHGRCQTIAFQRHRDTEIEIFVLDDTLVFQNEATEMGMLFHGSHYCPRDHDRRRGDMFTIFSFRRVTRFTNCVPSRIDLQVGRDHVKEFARDRRR